MLNLGRPDEGVLFVVSGPSGVGKSTLVQAAIAEIPALSFSVSATTRAPRDGEADGVDYHFLTAARFAELVEQGAFLEHATVYDRSYGTLAGPTRDALAAGLSLILDIDMQGSRQVRQAMPEAVHVVIVPPALDALEARLRDRGTDSDEVVARRMAQVAEQVAAVDEYDYVVVNDDLDTAHRVFQGIVVAELSRVQRRHTVGESIRRELRVRGLATGGG